MGRFTGIIRTVDLWDFGSALGEDFSDEAHELLYDYYTELSADLGEPIELDPIAMRSEWYEYDDDEAFIRDMGFGEVEGIREELEDIYEGDIGKRRVYRLANGNLLVQMS